MRPYLIRTSVMAVVFMAAFSSHVLAQANCALRNPDRQIYAIFPDATSYRTIEAEVNDENRRELEREIGSALATTDLGTHSAYIVLNGKVPIGFVHARSEIGSRGSVELVWAMDVDLTIIEFRVQRSREPKTKTIESDQFRSGIVGSNLADLRALMSNGNDEVDLASLGIPADSSAIAHTAVLCALKTRVITEYCFWKSVASAQILAHAHQDFDDVGKVSKIRTPFSKKVLDSIRERLGRALDQTDLTTIDVLRVRSESGDDVGILVRINWKVQPDSPDSWWAVRSDGTLKRATVIGRNFTAEQREIQAFQGKTFDEIGADATGSVVSSQRLAREVLAIVSAVRSGFQPSETRETNAKAPPGK
jgi:hypothetical protein